MTHETRALPRLFSTRTLVVVGTLLWLLLAACGSDATPVTTAAQADEPGVTESDVAEPGVIGPADSSEQTPPDGVQTQEPQVEEVEPGEAPTEEPETKMAPPEETQPATLELAPSDLVFVWVEDGGCFQAGPNCARYEVTADGTVSTFRVGQDGAEAVAQGVVSLDLIDVWIAAANETDIAALQARVGPGEMTAAFDGVDYFVAAPFAGLELSSVTNDFSRSEPLFAAAFDLQAASFESAPLIIEFR